MEALLTNMVSIVLVIKIFLLLTILGIMGASFFHRQESLSMEKRLGVILPKKVKFFASLHVMAALTILVVFTVLTFL